MVNKLVVDNQNIEINESTQIPFSYSFSTSGVHSVRIGLDNTEEICAYAFKNCSELTKVKFPSKITMIKRNAFENCTSLKSINIPKTIQYVGPNVFDGCDNLLDITFEDTVPPATFYDKLESHTNCYIPNDSKFIKVNYENTIKDGSVQYYEKNILGGYEEVDYESLEEGKDYYYDNWLTVHDHLHVIEEKFRVKPQRIAFVDNGIEVKTFGTIEQGTSAQLFDYVIEPENITNDKVYYYSNNPNLVSVSQSGVITAKQLSQGRATIYVCTEPDYENSYAFAFISVRVEDNSGIVRIDPELSFSTTMIEVNKAGELENKPTLINTHHLPLIWTSSKKSVATVDENGNVTIIANGSTRIKASFDGDMTYNSKDIYYDITVNIVEETVKIDPELLFSTDAIEVDTAGMLTNKPILTNLNNVPLTWSSSNTDIATVDGNGNVNVIDNGIVIIKAVFDGNDEYNAKEISYVLTINIQQVGPDQPTKEDPEISFNIENINITNDEQVVSVASILTNTYNLPLAWTSTNTSVATVDENGNVTIINNGTTIIKAIFGGNDEYNAKEISYTLTINIAQTPIDEPTETSDDINSDDINSDDINSDDINSDDINSDDISNNEENPIEAYNTSE